MKKNISYLAYILKLFQFTANVNVEDLNIVKGARDEYFGVDQITAGDWIEAALWHKLFELEGTTKAENNTKRKSCTNSANGVGAQIQNY